MASIMKARPISNAEFMLMFQRCRPPVGWSKKIAVANSGGPDSTCMLFLTNHLLSVSKGKGLPQSVVSLTVNHDLQPSSSEMAERCAKSALSIGVEHVTSIIPWSKPPFPERPSDTGSFENIARTARYHVLFNAMTRVGAKIIAFGHHADDQVETSLMRIGRGSTELGAGGMRPCRRWGMGLGRNENSMGWFGLEGMSSWILRPLIEFSKDRILATCEENRLDFVTDPTNFQPEITLRNALRQMLDRVEEHQTGTPTHEDQNLPIHIKETLKRIGRSASDLSMYISGGREQLRIAVKRLSSRVEDIDLQVTHHLKKRTLQSPIGTFLLSTYNLSEVADKTVRKALVLRIMRYVSFNPWGSVRAEGNRRSVSLQQIIDKLWHPNPIGSGIGRFVAGSGVLWEPVVVKSPGAQIVYQEQIRARGATVAAHSVGWLASRMAQPRNMLQIGVNPLIRDVTSLLSQAPESEIVDVLYDCRFLVRFSIAKMPEEVAAAIRGLGRNSSIVILPETVWLWPKVWWMRPGVDPIALASVGEQSKGCQETSLSWIYLEWIRPLDAT